MQVIALTRGGPYADVLGEHGIPVTILDKRLKLDVKAWRRLRQTLSELRPHILHTWLFAANAYGRLAVGRKRAIKLIVSERCVDSWKAGWQFCARPAADPPHRSADRQLAERRRLLSGAGFPCGENVGHLQRTGCAGCDRFLGSPIALQLIQDLCLPSDAKLIGFVGRLAKQKRIDDLLWGIQLARQADERAYLLIVGEGPERSRLEQHARDLECSKHVRFLGHREDAAKLMQAFDVFWLASDFEGLSNSLMEAMAVGVPVVASNIPPNRELVRHGQEGYLIDVGDGVGFAQYTIKLLHDAQLPQQLGDAGRSRIANDFSVQQMIDAHVALYRQVFAESWMRSTKCLSIS